MRGFLRLVLFGLIVALIIVAVFYAMPTAYNYLVLPVQNNRVVIDHLRRAETQMQKDMSSQQEQMAALESSLTAEREARGELESQLAQQAETIAAQATAIAQLGTDADAQALVVAGQSDLEIRLDEQEDTLIELEDTVGELETVLGDLEENTLAMGETQQQARVLQASQAIIKARLHLGENNPGLAQDSLEIVGEVLEELEILILPEQAEGLTAIQEQLETVVTAIDEQPFIATQELEILWLLLQQFTLEE
jgi:uncharacterized coiled-coil protein SlyX